MFSLIEREFPVGGIRKMTTEGIVSAKSGDLPSLGEENEGAQTSLATSVLKEGLNS